jgi:ABC-type dipeptide/oligopeptide/nickel transport system permease subunit
MQDLCLLYMFTEIYKKFFAIIIIAILNKPFRVYRYAAFEVCIQLPEVGEMCLIHMLMIWVGHWPNQARTYCSHLMEYVRSMYVEAMPIFLITIPNVSLYVTYMYSHNM